MASNPAAVRTVDPIARAAGEVRLPGSKSISNRALLLAALAQGATELSGVLDADDTRVMIAALRTLGVAVEVDGDRVRVAGCGGDFPNREADLFLGNAGTAMRPLAAVLAFAGGRYRLDGVARMRERPIGDLVDAVNGMGARVRYAGTPGYPPLQVEPADRGKLVPRVRVRGAVSSQFVTGLLLAAPGYARATAWRSLTIEIDGNLISQPYVAMTIAMMRQFGADVRAPLPGAYVVGPDAYRAPTGRYAVEGDASGASYFLALGAIAGGPVRVRGVGRDSLQGDVAFTTVLEKMGARVAIGDDWIETAGGGTGVDGRFVLQPVDWDCSEIPDAAMTVAVLALFARGTTRLRGIGSWRVKETDRIHAMATELSKLGAEVEFGDDWIAVTAPEQVREAWIDTYDDHRMAMCFSLAAAAGVPVHVRDPGCVAKTYPDYFDRLDALTRSATGAVAGFSSPGLQRAGAEEPPLPPGRERAGVRVAAPRVPVIAIDGPTASGKGTVAQRVAQELGFTCLDSGALYRIVGLLALEQGVGLDDGPALAAVADALTAAEDPVMRLRFADGRITLGARDITEAIRREEVGRAASRIATAGELRTALLALQRAQRRPPGLVADGRDMGTVVFPDASLKVFLIADVRVRAERRYKQLIEKGYPGTLETLLQDLEERDARDRTRDHAPLAAAEGAKILDSTAMTIDAVVAQVLGWYRAG